MKKYDVKMYACGVDEPAIIATTGATLRAANNFIEKIALQAANRAFVTNWCELQAILKYDYINELIGIRTQPDGRREAETIHYRYIVVPSDN